PTSLAVRKYLNGKKVPQLFPGSFSAMFDDPENYPWSMGWQPSSVYEAKAVADHILKAYPDGRIAILTQNDDGGRQVVELFRNALGADAEKRIVKVVTYETTDPSVDSQVVELQATGANIFINWTSPKQAAQA